MTNVWSSFGRRWVALPGATTALTALGVSSFIQTLLDDTTAAQAQATLGVREVLTAARTYYVRTDGSNSNNGLANTSGGAFLTVQKAIDVTASLDLSIYNVTIQLGDGTYTAGALVNGPWVGSGTVTIQGNTGTPGNTIIDTTGDCVKVQNGGALTVAAFEVRSGASGQSLFVDRNANLTVAAGMRFGTATNAHIYAENSGAIYGRAAYSIVGNAGQHWHSANAGVINIAGQTITLTGTPAFSSAFARASSNGVVIGHVNTFSGSATGVRYTALNGGGIFVNGAGASYLPGNSAGSATSPGWYA